jgi:hypothetical protein
MPQLASKRWPGRSRTTSVPLRNASGGLVIGSTPALPVRSGR